MSEASPTTLDFEGLLQNSRDPVFAVNARCRIVFLNAACAALLDVQPADLLSVECKAHGPVVPMAAAALAGQLRPPPEALAGTPCQSHVLLLDHKGKRSWRTIQWLPLADDAVDLSIVLGRIGAAAEDPAAVVRPEPLRQALARLRRQHHERFGFDHAIAVCPSMRRALEQVKLASQTKACVLLRGEPGTGKEHLARIIHAQSAFNHGPFLAFECGLPPGTLGDLLGTRAAQDCTLYLHEPARLPRDLQGLVLERWRNGALRLLAGAATDPAGAISEGALLPELHGALTTLVIELPPLRERLPDLPLLAQHALERCNAGSDHQITALSPGLLHFLEAYPWPSNLDELQDVLAQAHGRCRKAELDVADIPPALRAAAERLAIPPAHDERPLPLDRLLGDAERRLIQLAVRQARGNLSKAAARLAISRPRLYRRMQQLGLVEAPDETAGGSS